MTISAEATGRMEELAETLRALNSERAHLAQALMDNEEAIALVRKNMHLELTAAHGTVEDFNRWLR